jgi:pimeloyl-ACP methyl ester carboxylesterase
MLQVACKRAEISRGIITVLAFAGLVLLAAGCATPVGVTQLNLQAAYRLQTVSAISAGEPSEPSKTVLRRLGLLDRFEEQPDQVLAELHRGLRPMGDEDRLFALAELSFLHAERSGDRSYFLASAVYGWALLFPGAPDGAQLHQSDPRLRLAYDFYNQGVAQGLIKSPDQSDSSRNIPGATNDETAEVRLEPGTRTLPFGTMEVTLNESGLSWGGYHLQRFVPTTALGVRGLRNRYFHPGLGASLAASLTPGAASAKVAGAERIGPLTKVPVTALLRLDNARASLASGRLQGRIEIYAADQASSVTVDGKMQPLEYDPTAALAYQLDKNPFYAMQIAAFLRAGVFASSIPRDRAQDGLFMLHPYSAGKIPLVLVHGTLSSPVTWAELGNELEGDPRIRERYQIWLFFYDTGNPIGYSAGRLRAALTATVKDLDPEGKDAALQRMVVIGHSQGGLLTKLTAIDSGSRFWDRLSKKSFDEVELSPPTRALLKQSMFFTPLPFVARVVFMSTPHHGALLATGRLGAFAAWLVNLPVGLISQVAQAATASGDEGLIAVMRRPPTAIDNMNPQNPGLSVLQSIPVSSRIAAHSIIAVEGNGLKEEGDDGVVAYKSAHIDEAISELVVQPSGHSVQGKPQAIEEIRRILLEHAAVSTVIR